MISDSDPALALSTSPDAYVAPLLPATTSPPEPARKVSFIKALLLHWLLPRRYGPHLAAGSWRRAIGAHVLSLLVFGAAFLPIFSDTLPRQGLREAAAAMVLSMAAQTARNPVDWLFVLLMLGIVPLAQLGAVLLAILIMPWYAGGDRAGSVFKRSLKSVYWSTTIFIPLAVPIFLLTLYKPEPDRWLHQYGDLAFAAVVLLGLGLPPSLLIRMLLAGGTRYVGPADGPAFSPREPRCDDCGYLIIHLPLDSRCPECGLPVRESLPGGRRRPTVWQENELKPRGFVDLLRLQWEVWAHKDFFERLMVQSGLPAARHFWWGTWCLMLMATMVTLRVTTTLFMDRDEALGVLIVGTVSVVVVPLLLQSLMMFVACLYGQARYRIRDYRVSAVICYYASPLIWTFVPLPIIAMLVSRDMLNWLCDGEVFRSLVRMTGTRADIELMAVLFILGVALFWVLAGLLVWWRRLCRGLRDIRYANV